MKPQELKYLDMKHMYVYQRNILNGIIYCIYICKYPHNQQAAYLIRASCFG